MPDETRMILSLELNRTGDPIAGVLRNHRGVEWSFVGWIDFTEALEEARQTE